LSNIAEKLARKGSNPASGRQVRLKLRHLSIFSAAKVGFLVGVVLGVIGIIAALVAFSVLRSTGAIGQLDTLVGGVAGAGASGIVSSSVTFGTVAGISVAVAILGLIGYTLGGIIVAVLYNLSVRFTGGLFVGFTDERS
jgi:uncharacterized membrane protein